MDHSQTAHKAVLNVESHREHTFVQAQGANNVKTIWPSHQTSSHFTIETNSIIANTAVPNSIMHSGGFIEFIVPRHNKRIVTLSLELVMSVPSHHPSTLIRPIFAAIEKIEYFSGSSFLGASDYDSNYLRHCLLHSDEQLANMSSYTNVSPANNFREKDAEFTPGTTRTFYMDVTEMLQNLVPGLLNETLRLRVHFARGDLTFYSGLNSVAVDSAKVLLECETLTDGALSEIKQIYDSNKFSSRYFEARVQRVPLTMSPASNYQISLQNFFGNFSQLWICMGANMSSYMTTFAYADFLQSAYVTNAANQIMMGGTIQNAKWLRYMNAKSFPSSFINSQAVYPLVASKAGFVDLKSGKHSGSLLLTARGESLHLLTNDQTPEGFALYVTIIGWHASCIRVQNGNIIVLR